MKASILKQSAAGPLMYQALKAIQARTKGEWDNPALKVYGCLFADPQKDIAAIAEATLRKVEE